MTTVVSTHPKPLVVLVHGLFMHRAVMRSLARRLTADGHDVVRFGYNTLWGSLTRNAKELAAFLAQVCPGSRQAILVGHSMGGVVSWQAASEAAPEKVAALILLGSPVAGSKAARKVRALTGGAWSKAARTLHDWADQANKPSLQVPVFTLAGTREAGLGKLLCRFDEPSDGTVSVAETRVVSAMDAVTLPVSHTGMLFDARVARQISRWLQSIGEEKAPVEDRS